MTNSPQRTAVESLEPLIGEWRMDAVFPSTSPAAGIEADGVARVVFEYLPGRQFLIHRWEVPHPDAPDGIAIIGWDSGRDSLLQHYFDSRGVARLYEMSFGDGVWRLSRTAADFSPLEFAQRYTGEVSDDGRVIRGAWELDRWFAVGARLRTELQQDLMSRTDREPMNSADLVAVARELIDTNLHLTLATADNDAARWASPVWHAHASYRDLAAGCAPFSQHRRVSEGGDRHLRFDRGGGRSRGGIRGARRRRDPRVRAGARDRGLLPQVRSHRPRGLDGRGRDSAAADLRSVGAL
jgi:hypothetical protein